MAIPIPVRRILGRVHISARLLDGQAAVTDGEWIDLRGVYPTSLSITGIDGDTVQVRYLNGPEMPGSEEDGVQLGSDIQADIGVFIEAPVDFLKVIVTTYGEGSINADLSGLLL